MTASTIRPPRAPEDRRRDTIIIIVGVAFVVMLGVIGYIVTKALDQATQVNEDNKSADCRSFYSSKVTLWNQRVDDASKRFDIETGITQTSNNQLISALVTIARTDSSLEQVRAANADIDLATRRATDAGAHILLLLNPNNRSGIPFLLTQRAEAAKLYEQVADDGLNDPAAFQAACKSASN